MLQVAEGEAEAVVTFDLRLCPVLVPQSVLIDVVLREVKAWHQRRRPALRRLKAVERAEPRSTKERSPAPMPMAPPPTHLQLQAAQPRLGLQEVKDLLGGCVQVLGVQGHAGDHAPLAGLQGHTRVPDTNTHTHSVRSHDLCDPQGHGLVCIL